MQLAAACSAAAGEITAEARAESPTKLGIRGETAETEKKRQSLEENQQLSSTKGTNGVDNKLKHRIIFS